MSVANFSELVLKEKLKMFISKTISFLLYFFLSFLVVLCIPFLVLIGVLSSILYKVDKDFSFSIEINPQRDLRKTYNKKEEKNSSTEPHIEETN
ncbi:hypothetical protein SAMN06265182_1245 [Persephonella hydrogeniphila]|uniref:Uncharacterized protein n=1 Tax=Persephonella hydrogeniphila TaxID=198703 RepID=A0A285NFI9_9AQUI|nr:hypothetical protein [Persephonella hydrogeniphila]SNZ08272.1 hypothetical protein SAMN06265182_1245 [Persephonella hydrogeniphila]